MMSYSLMLLVLWCYFMEKDLEKRIGSLQHILFQNNFVRLLDSYNGLSGMVVDKLKIEYASRVLEFDGMWVGSLTTSTMKGMPDNDVVDFACKIRLLKEILHVTSKPVVYDGGTVSSQDDLSHMINSIEKLGVSAIVIEDKVGFKKNSLINNNSCQKQDSVANFCKKIAFGKYAKNHKEFMLIARIESFILDNGLKDALKRAHAYIESGADAIMIHSKSSNPMEVISFCKEYSNFSNKKPLMVSPTTYFVASEDELIKNGVNIIVYANHMLRAIYPVMIEVASSILRDGGSFNINERLISIEDVLDIVPGNK